MQFGRALSDDVRAVHITIDSESTERLRADWEHILPGVPLVVIETPFRSLVVPFLHYLDVMAPSSPETITIVVLPEYVPRHWWDRFLHNQKVAAHPPGPHRSTRHGRGRRSRTAPNASTRTVRISLTPQQQPPRRRPTARATGGAAVLGFRRAQ